MITNTQTDSGAVPAAQSSTQSRLFQMLADGWTVIRRDVGHLRYAPAELASGLAFPAILVILFGYIFGSAITVPGGNYHEYLIPGLFGFAMVTAIGSAAVSTANDAAQGIMDRFRSMPIARSAVPFGRAGATLFTSALQLVVLISVGLAIGWRTHHGPADIAAAFGLLLLMDYALGWLGVYLGLLVGNPTTADALLPMTFPIAMVSNAFVPTAGMPTWLRVIANWNPVSALVAACRQLFGNPSIAAHNLPWPLQHPAVATLIWGIGLTVIFAPLATHRYRTSTR
jgi:ABC-2 type transport system permease protein